MCLEISTLQMKDYRATCHILLLSLLLSLGWGKHLLIQTINTSEDNDETEAMKEEGDDYKVSDDEIFGGPSDCLCKILNALLG